MLIYTNRKVFSTTLIKIFLFFFFRAKHLRLSKSRVQLSNLRVLSGIVVGGMVEDVVALPIHKDEHKSYFNCNFKSSEHKCKSASMYTELQIVNTVSANQVSSEQLV